MKNSAPYGGNYAKNSPQAGGTASPKNAMGYAPAKKAAEPIFPGGMGVKNIALAIACLVIIAFVVNFAVTGSAQEVKGHELDVKLKNLQSQLDSLQVEKTRTDESLLQATLEKEELKTQQANAIAKASKDAIEARAALVANASKLKQLLSTREYDKAVLDQASQQYAQWDAYACQYYLGLYAFTTQGSISVPLGCVLANSVYVNSSRFLIAQISNSTANPVTRALGELKAQYPELEK